jgi:hypothetical protein
MKKLIKLLASISVILVGSIVQQMYIPGLVKNVGGLSPLSIIIPTALIAILILWAIWFDESKISKRK